MVPLCFALDIDIVTCQLPVSPKFNLGQDDMCPIPEETESSLDFLTLPPHECAEQLTVMDAVSLHCYIFVSCIEIYDFSFKWQCY